MNMMKLTSNWPTHWIDDYDKTDLELTHQMLINWPWIDPPKPSENCKGEIGLRDAGGAETNCKFFVIMMSIDNLSKWWWKWQFIQMMQVTIYPTNQPMHCIALYCNDVNIDKWSNQWGWWWQFIQWCWCRQVIWPMMFVTKKGSQQMMKTPITVPKVFAAFVSFEILFMIIIMAMMMVIKREEEFPVKS